MIRLKLAMLLIAMILLCSCQANAQSVVQVNGQNTGISELDTTIRDYFHAFNDIRQWSAFATDDFIEQVYELCSGDRSGSKTIAEIKELYFEINKNSLSLAECTIDEIEKVSSNQVDIHVTRKWENGDEDQTGYSIVQADKEWKFDQRF